MTGQKTGADIVNRFRGATDVQTGLAIFIDEEKQGIAREELEVILHAMLEWDDHGKKNVDAGLGSNAQMALNVVQRQVVEHVLAVIFRAKLVRR